jgi:hypothetical protein
MKNSVEQANNLIFRARNLKEFTVTTELPENFSFNGTIPFDLKIKDNVIEAKVWAVDFDEAAVRLNEYLESCNNDDD